MALDRRGFLMFAAGGAAGSVLTPVAWKLTDDISIWTQNWPWVPRIPAGSLDARPSLLKLGAAEYGIQVHRVNKQPITASGNPNHPLSLGGIDPLGAASIQLLYSPSRVKRPLLKNEQGQFKPLAWTQAMDLLRNKLKPLKGQPQGLACCSGDWTGSTRDLLAGFLQSMGSKHFYLQPTDGLSLTKVWNELMHGQGHIGFDQESADLLLVLEPDLLESWGAPVKSQKYFGRGRTEYIYAGALQNSTAAVANRWLPILAGSSGHTALSLAYYLLQENRQPRSLPQGFKAYRDFVLKHYTPEQAARKTGLDPQTLQDLARKLRQASRPLVLSGSTTGQGAPGFTFFAGLSLNLLLDRINAPGGLNCLPFPEKAGPALGEPSALYSSDFCSYMENCSKGRISSPEVLFVHEANPLHALPDSQNTSDFFDTIPFKVSLSQFMDETAARSDLILPNPYFLERLEDSFTPFGSSDLNYSLAQPVIKPLTDSKPTAELTISLAQAMDIDLGFRSFADLLRHRVKGLGADWKRLNNGETWTSRQTLPQAGIQIWNQDIEAMCHSQLKDQPSSLNLVLEKNLKAGSSRTGLLPFGLKAHLEEELSGSLISVRVNSQTAARLKVRDGQAVTLKTKAGRIAARILLDEGVMPQTMALPTGFGHTAFDLFSQDKGGNANTLLSLAVEPGSGLCYGTAKGFQVSIQT